jgi:hypothetical protein
MLTVSLFYIYILLYVSGMVWYGPVVCIWAPAIVTVRITGWL